MSAILRVVNDPAALRSVWPMVREGLARIEAKTSPDWLPEDLYSAVRTGAATLVVCDEIDGFVILQQQGRPYGKCLLVWVAWCENGEAWRTSGIYAELERMARECGAQKLEMHSPRNGWLKDGFWTPRETVFVHEVGNGSNG